MSKPSFLTLLFSGLLTVILIFGFTKPVSAFSIPRPANPLADRSYDPGKSDKSKTGTVLMLNEPAVTNLGEPFTLSGVIKDQYGFPVADKHILFQLDGEYLGQALSDENGAFEHKFTKILNAGNYAIQAVSKATQILDQSSGFTSLTIIPAKFQIQTVPPIAGVPFEMNGTRFVSGDDGFAHITINEPGTYRLEVLADQYYNPNKRIQFARWLDNSYQPFKDVQVPSDKIIQVGLNVYHEVGQTFVDLEGNPVDPKTVTEFTIRSAQGDMFVLHDGQPRWIPASRVARRVTGLEETKLLYSVLSVTVDGSNVVNKSQQRFYTYPQEYWPISLLLYTLRISAKDGLFGFPVGQSVNVEFPDGHVENYPLGPSGMVEIHSLPRGNYYTELVGTNGLSNRYPVALSRDQDVNTKVITYLDIGVVGMVGVFIALGLLLYGRPALLHPLRRKARPGSQDRENISVHLSESLVGKSSTASVPQSVMDLSHDG